MRAAGFAGLLYDVGKADIPLEILNKPGRLSDEEFAIVREHPRKGWDPAQWKIPDLDEIWSGILGLGRG